MEELGKKARGDMSHCPLVRWNNCISDHAERGGGVEKQIRREREEREGGEAGVVWGV